MKSRIAEEKKTVEQMIKLYCRHKEGHAVLCDSCRALLLYKTAYAESDALCRPRMLWYHPMAVTLHLWRELE